MFVLPFCVALVAIELFVSDGERGRGLHYLPTATTFSSAVLLLQTISLAKASSNPIPKADLEM